MPPADTADLPRSLAKCLRRCLSPESEWLEARCAELAAENEKLHKKIRELQEAPASSPVGLSSPMLRRFSSGAIAQHHRGRAASFSASATVHNGAAPLTVVQQQQQLPMAQQHIAAMAVEAAAEATAEYQSSLVTVKVDNEQDEHATLVTVHAPNRPYLLGDMAGAFSGLGLSVCQAVVEASNGSSKAALTFSLLDGGRKVLERDRLRAIEERVQQRFRGRHGLNGGVRRLIVERFLRAEPPWHHSALEPARPTPDDAQRWIACLSTAIGPAMGGGTALGGAVSSVLAARCAAELLPEMVRMQLPPGALISNEQTAGEWLLIVESRASVVATPAATPPPPTRRPPPKRNDHTDTPSAESTIAVLHLAAHATAAEGSLHAGMHAASPHSSARRALYGARNGTGRTSSKESLTGSSPAPARPNGLSASAPPGFDMPVVFGVATEANVALAGRPLPWSALCAPADGDGLTVRGCHLSTLQQKLLTLREAAAREHAHVLADIPLFAPLTSAELLALCRRATLIEVGAGRQLLPAVSPPPADDDPLAAEVADVVGGGTFGVVLSGNLQMLLAPPAGGRDDATPWPLSSLGVLETFGELGTPPPDGVVMRAGATGATLLCWPRHIIFDDELHKLSLLEGGTSLLERSWLARSPLAMCVAEPALLRLLRPMPLADAQRAEADGTLDAARSLVLVTRGEVLRRAASDAEVEVEIRSDEASKLADANGAAAVPGGQLELAVVARWPMRGHSLTSLSDHLADLGLVLRKATSDSSSHGGVVCDTFHVSMPLKPGANAADAARALQRRLQLLCATRMHPGDAVLAVAADGSSRLARLVQHESDGAPTAVAVLDLGALGAAFARCPGDTPARWRRFVAVHAPHLLPPLEVAADAEGALDATAAAASVRAAEERGQAGEQAADTEVAPPSAGVGGETVATTDAGACARGGEAWRGVICAFLLYQLRQAAGEADVGVAFSELELGQKLGAGGYGVVRLARHRVSGRLFAVKSLLKSRIRRVGEQRTFELLGRERRTLKLLATADGRSATGLTRLICAAHDAMWLHLVMPAYLGGDLSTLLEACGRAMPSESVQFHAGCLVLALSRLHDLGIAYRDLKPENVLLDANGWPVLSDFGLVAFTRADDGTEQPSYSMIGTPEFMAPEVVASAGHGTDADWWGLGVTLSELLTGYTPFREREYEQHAHQKTCANIMNGRYARHFQREIYRRLESRAASLLDGLLCVDTTRRLGGMRRGVESLRVHPFFWGLSWEALERHELTPPHSRLCAAKRESHGAFKGALDLELPTEPAAGGGASAAPPAAAPAPAMPDAAAKALDKIFDFGDWGDEYRLPMSPAVVQVEL